MTEKDLLRAGFKAFKPNGNLHDRWTMGYQYRVTDEYGTRYFVNVFSWDMRQYGAGLGWEAELTANEGLPDLGLGSFALQVKAYAGIDGWTPQDVLRWADYVWNKLKPKYYQRRE